MFNFFGFFFRKKNIHSEKTKENNNLDLTQEQKSLIKAVFVGVLLDIMLSGKNLRAKNVPVYENRTSTIFRNENGQLIASSYVYPNPSFSGVPQFSFETKINTLDDMKNLQEKMKRI